MNPYRRGARRHTKHCLVRYYYSLIICKYNSNGTLIATIGRDVGTMKFKQYNYGIAVKGDMILLLMIVKGRSFS